MSQYKDSRPLNVDLDYDSLDILCPTSFQSTISTNSSFAISGKTIMPDNTPSITVYSLNTVPGVAYIIDITVVAYQPSTTDSFAQKTMGRTVNVAGVISNLNITLPPWIATGILGAAINYTMVGNIVNINLLVTPTLTSSTNWGWDIKIYSSS